MSTAPRRGLSAPALVLRLTLAALLLALIAPQIHWHSRAVLLDGTTLPLVDRGEWTVRDSASGSTRRLDPAEVVAVRPGVGPMLARLHWRPAAAALLLALPIPFLLAQRWRLLLRALGVAPPPGLALSITLKHYPLNLIGLGTASGEIYRAAALGRSSWGWSKVLASLVLDRATGLGALALVALAASLGTLRDPDVGQFALPMTALWAVALLSGLVLWRAARSVRLRCWLGVEGRGAGQRWLARVRSALADFLVAIGRLPHDRGTLLRVAAVSLLAQLLLSVAAGCAALALGLDRPFVAVFVALPAAILIALVAPTPQGFGAFEWALVTLVGPHESGGAGSGLVLALAFRLILLCWAVPGALLWLWGGGRRVTAGRRLPRETVVPR